MTFHEGMVGLTLNRSDVQCRLKLGKSVHIAGAFLVRNTFREVLWFSKKLLTPRRYITNKATWNDIQQQKILANIINLSQTI